MGRMHLRPRRMGIHRVMNRHRSSTAIDFFSITRNPHLVLLITRTLYCSYAVPGTAHIPYLVLLAEETEVQRKIVWGQVAQVESHRLESKHACKVINKGLGEGGYI